MSHNHEEQHLDALAINSFRKYLQISSVHPHVDYKGCVDFLQEQAKSLNLPIDVIYVEPDKPVIIITWTGQKPKLPSILLNSHMDVVPVYEDKWTYKPFEATVENGKIYARGTQDMKSVGIQYLEAIRRLKLAGVSFVRTIHICFVPDEEISGFIEVGMTLFVKTKKFKELNVGFSLDEGIASPSNHFTLFYGERCSIMINITCHGQTGHGSNLLPNTAGQKLSNILKKFSEFRKKQQNLLKENPSLTLGDVTSVNVTKLSGGIKMNVLPAELKVVIDCRLAVTEDLEEWKKTVIGWCQEAGKDVDVEFKHVLPQVPVTKLDNSNPYWAPFSEAINELGIEIKPQIFSAGTDSQLLRQEGIPAIGFSPINNTPVLLHDHDEYLGIDTFLKGIDIYCGIIKKIANLEA